MALQGGMHMLQVLDRIKVDDVDIALLLVLEHNDGLATVTGGFISAKALVVNALQRHVGPEEVCKLHAPAHQQLPAQA